MNAGGAGGMGACTGALAFADPDVEAWIRELISVPAGPIHAKDVAGLTATNLVAANVPACPMAPDACVDFTGPPRLDGWATSLEGVECLTATTSFAVDAASLNLEPLRALPHLNDLFLGYVDDPTAPSLPQVNSLEGSGPPAGFLSAFPNLTSLTIYGRNVRTPASLDEVAALSGLTSLSLRFYGVTDVSPLAPLTHLTHLDLTGNQSLSLDGLAGMTALTELSLDSCALTQISVLSKLTNLTQLDLSSNSIRDLSPLVANDGLGAGNTLYLSDNPIDCAAQAAHIRALRGRGVTVDLGSACP